MLPASPQARAAAAASALLPACTLGVNTNAGTMHGFRAEPCNPSLTSSQLASLFYLQCRSAWTSSCRSSSWRGARRRRRCRTPACGTTWPPGTPTGACNVHHFSPNLHPVLHLSALDHTASCPLCSAPRSATLPAHRTNQAPQACPSNLTYPSSPTPHQRFHPSLIPPQTLILLPTHAPTHKHSPPDPPTHHPPTPGCAQGRPQRAVAALRGPAPGPSRLREAHSGVSAAGAGRPGAAGAGGGPERHWVHEAGGRGRGGNVTG